MEHPLRRRSLVKSFPDVSPLLKKKAARRKRQAELSFEEKIAIVNKWRRLSKQIRKSQTSRALGRGRQKPITKVN
jgi:hypothetical protein